MKRVSKKDGTPLRTTIYTTQAVPQRGREKREYFLGLFKEVTALTVPNTLRNHLLYIQGAQEIQIVYESRNAKRHR